MAQRPDKQQRTDRERIGERGSGKLDRDASGDRRVVRRGSQPSVGATGEASLDQSQARLVAARDAAVEQLRGIGISAEGEDNAPRAGADSVRDEGDEAQASERQDVAFFTRERLAERINRLTAALERIQDGTYGRCAVCGEPIEPARLAALPEADTCLRCQGRREQAEPERAA